MDERPVEVGGAVGAGGVDLDERAEEAVLAELGMYLLLVWSQLKRASMFHVGGLAERW